MSLITGIAHVNLTVPPGTLPLAQEFYGTTLGFKSMPVPALQRDTLAWFDITPGGQQIHIAHPANGHLEYADATRHPCFKVAGPEALRELQERIWRHHQAGSESSPTAADRPGGESSGAKGAEYPQRFFARDYANNRLEFSL